MCVEAVYGCTKVGKITHFLKLYFESSYHNLLKDYLVSENRKSEEIIPELFKISKDLNMSC